MRAIIELWPGRAVVVAAVASLVALVGGCGGEADSTKDRYREAITTALDQETIAFSFSVEVGGRTIDGLEVAEPSTGHFDLSVPSDGVTVHGRGSMVVLDSDPIRQMTGGRRISFKAGTIDVQLDRELGELADLFDSGLVRRYLRALNDIGEFSIIGRTVVESQPTTHVLVESTQDVTDSPVEVWVSDDGNLVQLEYLTASGNGDAVTVVLVAEQDSRPLVDIGATRVVAAEQFEQEQREAEEAAREAENAARDAEEAQVEKEEKEEAEQLEEAVAADAELATSETDDLAALLDEAWSSESRFGIARTDGYACRDSARTSGDEIFAVCKALPDPATLDPTCDAVAAVATAFDNGTRSDWLDATTAALEASTSMNATVDVYWFELVRGSFRLRSREEVALLVEETEWLDGAARRGGVAVDGLSATYQYNALLSLDSICSVRPRLPAVVSIAWPDDPELLQRVGDDPLFARLPIRPGDEGDHVRQLQSDLMAAGIEVGSSGADGSFGPDTSSAVGQLQYNVGLKTTEVFGVEELDALRRWIETTEADYECPTSDEIENPAPDMQGFSGPVSDIRCTRSNSLIRIVIYQETPDSGPPLWVLATEGHVVWIPIASASTRPEVCVEAPQVLASYTDDVAPMLADLGC